MPTQSGLIANNISLTISGQSILRDLNLHVREGSVLGILGPNGAGKTSFLKVLSGQLLGSGQVLWRGDNIHCFDPRSLAQRIAVVNQLNDPVFALTLEQIVGMGLLPHQRLLSRKSSTEAGRIRQAIELVGLSAKSKQEFSTLSGGEQQRALIARALVQDAPLLILDEPVNHLDIYYQHEILHLLHVVTRELNKTVVLTLHDLNLSAQYCDQLCLLKAGKIVAQGKVDEVLAPATLEPVFKLRCQRHNKHSQPGFSIEFLADEHHEYDFQGWL